MNLTASETKEFCREFLANFSAKSPADVGIAPPLTSLSALSEALGSDSGVLVGAQNVHWLESGAHTGEVSAKMLCESGVQFVIVGHSERRQFYGETNAGVAKRAKAAIDVGLTTIVCVGESEEEFKAEQTSEVVTEQLREGLTLIESSDVSKLVIAYEPVWAIGTGLTASPEIAEGVHKFIREGLVSKFGAAGKEIAILYGGSTKPDNIAELMSRPNVNGALVGGASLKPDSFNELIEAGRAASF